MTAGFHEVRFPLRLALGTSGGPVRRTDIVSLSNGRENRNSRWSQARRGYDAGSGVRSVGDLYEILVFFEARRGALYGFRFRDPVDFQSCGPEAMPGAFDQTIAVADGVKRAFQLTKAYADDGGVSTRTIAKPVAGSVMVSVDGVAVSGTQYAVDTVTGIVTFLPGHVPAMGKVIRAGFAFDVPVRFETDRIDIDLSQFQAGRIPTIPLTEVVP